jgi:hypothetical protein
VSRSAQWLTVLLFGGVVILDIAVAFGTAIYSLAYARTWEVPGILVSLTVGALIVGWFTRVRQHGWLVANLAGTAFGISFALAIVHGWENQAFVAVIVTFLAWQTAAPVIRARIQTRQEIASRAMAVATRGTAQFRDDGERIVVYPNREQLLRRLLRVTAFTALFTALFAFGLASQNVLLQVLCALAGAYMVSFALLLLYRMLVRRPTLLIGSEGITDFGSLTASGVGLIAWDEIWSIGQGRTSSRRSAQPTLEISVVDPHAVRRRMPPVKRLASVVLLVSGSLSFAIWQDLLDEPVARLIERIGQYVETHDPEGWFGDDDAEEEDGGAEPEP